MANASLHHTGAFHEQQQQEGVALLVLNGDGSLTVHPAAVQGVFPGLVSSLLGNGSPASLTPTLRNVEAFPGIPRGANACSPSPTPSKTNQYDQALRENFQRGRNWASKIRRVVQATGCEPYEAMQNIATQIGVPVTDVRVLVELSNKAVRPRGKAIRRAILWKWHCEGSSHRASAERFPFPLHEKTVAADVKAMKEAQL